MFLKLHSKVESELEDWCAMGGPLATFTQIGVGLFLLLWIPICAIIWILTWPVGKLHTCSTLELSLLYLLILLAIANQILCWS